MDGLGSFPHYRCAFHTGRSWSPLTSCRYRLLLAEISAKRVGEHTGELE